MSQRTCSVDGCHRIHYARGWCNRHYNQWHKSSNRVVPKRRLTCYQCEGTWLWEVRDVRRKPMLCSSCALDYKYCHRCNQSRPMADWYANNGRGDGKQTICIPCLSVPRKRHVCGRCGVEFKRKFCNQKKLIHLCDPCEINYKWCSKCETIKCITDFAVAYDKRVGRVAHCKQCINDGYSSPNRRKRILANYGLTDTEWQQLHDKQDGLCAICHRPPNGGQWPVLYTDHDHETGLVRGLLCANCNKGIGCLQDNVLIIERAADYLRSHRKEVREVI
jgi:Recombination endonuclease VII